MKRQTRDGRSGRTWVEGDLAEPERCGDMLWPRFVCPLLCDGLPLRQLYLIRPPTSVRSIGLVQRSERWLSAEGLKSPSSADQCLPGPAHSRVDSLLPSLEKRQAPSQLTRDGTRS
jgi:hypothetical protein